MSAYVIRAVKSGKPMYYCARDKMFSQDRTPSTYATPTRAKGVAQKLLRAHKVLRTYQLAVVPQSATRRVNPSLRDTNELAESKKLFADFTGHSGNHVLRKHIKPIKTGLAFGILDDVGYTTIRDGVVESYRHAFKKISRPLLIVSHDGKQLGIVGGRYQFTEAGIEDR